MWLYINYPEPHFTAHHNPSCPRIRMHGKPGQRVRRVTIPTLDDLLSEVMHGRLRFASERAFNDLWVEVRLDTPGQEIGLVHVLQAMLGRRYRPLAHAPIAEHC